MPDTPPRPPLPRDVRLGLVFFGGAWALFWIVFGMLVYLGWV